MVDSQVNCVVYRRFFSRSTAALLLCASSILSCVGSPDPIDVTLRVDQPLHSLSAAVFTVNYLNSGAEPLSSGGVPACFALHPGMTAGFSDDGNGTLTVKVASTAPFSTPLDLAACRMLPLSDDIDHRAVAHGLRVAVNSATSSDGSTLEHSELGRGDKGNRRMARADSGTRRQATPRGAPADSATKPTADSPRHDRAASTATGTTGTSAATGRPDSGNKPGTDNYTGSAARRQAARDWQREAEADRRRAEEQGRIPADDRLSGRGNDFPGQNPGQNTEQDNANQPVDETPDDGDSPAPTAPTITYELRLAVNTSGTSLGALQFELRHLGSSGGFVGRGGSVECSGSISGAMATFNNVGNGKVKGAIIDIDGFPIPTEVATCSFRTSEDLSAASFNMTVIEATDADLSGTGQSLDPFPGMAVVDVRELN